MQLLGEVRLWRNSAQWVEGPTSNFLFLGNWKDNLIFVLHYLRLKQCLLFPPISFFINFWPEDQTQGSILWAKTLLLPYTSSLSYFSSDITMTTVMDSGLPLLSIQKFIIIEIFVKPSLHTAHSLKCHVSIQSSQHSMAEHGRQGQQKKGPAMLSASHC